jgi:hypothetical protein
LNEKRSNARAVLIEDDGVRLARRGIGADCALGLKLGQHLGHLAVPVGVSRRIRSIVRACVLSLNPDTKNFRCVQVCA